MEKAPMMGDNDSNRSSAHILSQRGSVFQGGGPMETSSVGNQPQTVDGVFQIG